MGTVGGSITSDVMVMLLCSHSHNIAMAPDASNIPLNDIQYW